MREGLVHRAESGADPPPMNEKAASRLLTPVAALSQTIDADKASKAKDTSLAAALQAGGAFFSGGWAP